MQRITSLPPTSPTLIGRSITSIKRFDDTFQVRKNVIFERARFNQRCQGESKSAEQFIMSLYNLAENCEYSDLKDQMIRDRIVVGIHDQSQSV